LGLRNEKPTDVTVSILFVYRRIYTCFGPTGPSSGEFTQLFPQPLVQYPYISWFFISCAEKMHATKSLKFAIGLSPGGSIHLHTNNT